jgi:hypothetical protein
VTEKSQSAPMITKIKGKESLKFNPALLYNGAPLWYAYNVNEHWFNGLVHEYGPYFLIITNGLVKRTIDLEEIVSGTCEIVRLHPASYDIEDQMISDDLIVQCQVFDVGAIPVGSLYVDQDGVSFVVSAVDPFYLELRDHNSDTFDVQAEIFFDLDEDERENCRLVIPPLVVEQMIQQASAYQERV